MIISIDIVKRSDPTDIKRFFHIQRETAEDIQRDRVIDPTGIQRQTYRETERDIQRDRKAETNINIKRDRGRHTERQREKAKERDTDR